MSNNELFFMRHGQTYWNKSGIMHGQYDIPLNTMGIEQAKKMAVELKQHYFDLCFCSPLQRAKQTANISLLYSRNTPIFQDDRLKELDKGLLEGTYFSSEKTLKKDNKWILSKYKVESKQYFFNRVAEFINELEKKYHGKKILIVSHCGTMRMCYFYFNPPKKPLSEAYFDINMQNCKLYKFN